MFMENAEGLIQLHQYVRLVLSKTYQNEAIRKDVKAEIPDLSLAKAAGRQSCRSPFGRLF